MQKETIKKIGIGTLATLAGLALVAVAGLAVQKFQLIKEAKKDEDDIQIFGGKV